MHIGQAIPSSKKILQLFFMLLGGFGVGLVAPYITNRLQLDFRVFVALALVFPILILIEVIKEKIGIGNLLWLLLMLGTSVSFRRRDLGLIVTSEAIDEQVIIQLAIWTVCGLFVLYRLFIRPSSFTKFIKTISKSPIIWIVIYGFIALISTAYSTFRALTFVSSLQFIIIILFLGVIITFDKVPEKTIMTTTLLGILLIEIVIWVIYFVAPKIAITVEWPNLQRLGGILIHPNNLGIVAAVVAVIALSRYFVMFRMSNRLVYLAVFLGSVVTLIATQSRAALVAWLLASITVLVFLKRKFLFLLGVILLLSIILFIPETGNWAIEKFTRGENVAVLTGRVDVWKFVLNQAGHSFQSLFLGYGFGVSRLSLLEQLPGHWTHTHNAFIEALMGLGIFGALILAISFLSAGSILLKRLLVSKGESYAYYVELLAVFIIIAVVNMTSAGVGGRVSISSFIFLGVLISCI